jgi:hypothetical protein
MSEVKASLNGKSGTLVKKDDGTQVWKSDDGTKVVPIVQTELRVC